MKQQSVVFDCDDVLLDWIGGFCQYHNKYYGTEVNGENATNYDLSEFLGLERPVLEQRAYDFNRSYEFGCLEPMRYAVDVIHYLRDYNQSQPEEKRIKIYILSKCGNDELVRKLRLANLQGVFGEDCFDEIILIEGHQSKQPYLQQIKDTTDLLLFVDDYVGNCNVGHSVGINSVVIQRNHNKHLKERNPHLHFCRDWMHLMSVHIARFIRVD